MKVRLDDDLNDFIRQQIKGFTLTGIKEFVLSKVDNLTEEEIEHLERRIQERLFNIENVICLQFQDLVYWTLYEREQIEKKQKKEKEG
jgi:ethanolamine ammonia-lyase large subunit